MKVISKSCRNFLETFSLGFGVTVRMNQIGFFTLKTFLCEELELKNYKRRLKFLRKKEDWATILAQKR